MNRVCPEQLLLTDLPTDTVMEPILSFEHKGTLTQLPVWGCLEAV